jgi:hypothetical protein
MMLVGVAISPLPVFLDASIHRQPFFTCFWLFVLWLNFFSRMIIHRVAKKQ